MKNKRILIVTHQFLPFASPRTTRWNYLIDELIRKGNEVTVLSGTNPENIERNYDILYYGNKQFSSNIGKIRQDSKDSTNDFSKKIIYSILKKIYRFLFRTFSWPDYAMFWVVTILRNKKLIINDYDIIVSVSLPFTSHLCAYILKKRIQADWYMDIGDPFTLKTNSLENNRFIYSFLNKFYERKFYKIASKIIFTHKEVAELHQNKFNIEKSKIVIGYPIALVSEENLAIAKSFNYTDFPIKVGYFGAFTRSVREPSNYLKNIGNLMNEDTEHIWYINEESKKYFASMKKTSQHKFIDIVPRDEAIKIMVNEIHILLSIGNLNKYQMPSKVIEYLSLGKPVLHYAEIESDPIYNFEKLFDNLKIINNKTSKTEIENYIENIKEQKFELDVITFNNNFSASKLINDLS